MEFLKKCKKQSMKRAIGCALLWLIAGALMLSLSGMTRLFRKPKDLYSVPEDRLVGAYVTVDLPFLYGSYAYTEEHENGRPTGRIVSEEFVVDANEYSFCGLLLPEELVEQGEALLEESIRYMDGETDTVSGGFTVTGVVERMDEDSLYYYHDLVGYVDLPKENQDMFLPLVLKVPSSSSNTGSIVFGVLGLVFLAMIPVMIVPAASGKHQKQLAAKAEELSPGNPEYIYSRLEQLCETEKAVSGLRFDQSLVFMNRGFRQQLYGAREICWAYQHTTTHKVNGIIPAGKTHALTLRTLDGKQLEITMPKKSVEEQLQKLAERIPTCVIGYSDELAAMYQNQREQLAQIAAAQHGYSPAPQGGENAAEETADVEGAPEGPADAER